MRDQWSTVFDDDSAHFDSVPSQGNLEFFELARKGAFVVNIARAEFRLNRVEAPDSLHGASACMRRVQRKKRAFID